MSVACGGDDGEGSGTKRKREDPVTDLSPALPESSPSTSRATPARTNQAPPAEGTRVHPAAVHRSLELAATVLSPISRDETINLFPFSSYIFGSKEETTEKDPFGRLDGMRKEYEDEEGMRIRVEGIIPVGIGQGFRVHVLFLQRDSEVEVPELPGGYLNPEENEIEGLKRILNNRIGASSENNQTNWQIGDCVGNLWRHESTSKLYPFPSPQSKENIKFFIVHLAGGERIDVPQNFTAVPLSLQTLWERRYQSSYIYAEIPHMLSRYDFKFVGPKFE